MFLDCGPVEEPSTAPRHWSGQEIVRTKVEQIWIKLNSKCYRVHEKCSTTVFPDFKIWKNREFKCCFVVRINKLVAPGCQYQPQRHLAPRAPTLWSCLISQTPAAQALSLPSKYHWHHICSLSYHTKGIVIYNGIYLTTLEWSFFLQHLSNLMHGYQLSCPIIYNIPKHLKDLSELSVQ